MPPEVSPEHLKDWNPYTFLVFAVVIGMAIMWFFNVGWEKIQKIKERKDRERERISKLRREAAANATLDQIWEDKNLAGGWKALLHMQDARIRELENQNAMIVKDKADLHTAYLHCIENHSEQKALAQRFERELTDCRALADSLEHRVQELTSKYENKRGE
jgi:hypothetical protein